MTPTHEEVIELREWCRPRRNATDVRKQPRDSWLKLTALCDEILLLRAENAELRRSITKQEET